MLALGVCVPFEISEFKTPLNDKFGLANVMCLLFIIYLQIITYIDYILGRDYLVQDNAIIYIVLIHRFEPKIYYIGDSL